MISDNESLKSQAGSLESAFAAVQDYLDRGGIIPQCYDNEDGIGRLVNYVFQGQSGINFSRDSDGNFNFDTTIMDI